MDAQRFSSFGKVLFVSREGFPDVEVFELTDRLGEQDVAVQHLVNQGFKSGAHSFQQPVRENSGMIELTILRRLEDDTLPNNEPWSLTQLRQARAGQAAACSR